jgi:quercetin dioxygenase-like cupin family protein
VSTEYGRAVAVADLESLELRASKLDVYDAAIGVHLLYEDPGTGAEHYLVRYPAGLGARPHRHTAAHTVVLLEGRLRVNDEVIAAHGYCHFPAGETMYHGPADDGPCLFVLIFDGPYDVTVVDE